MMCSFFNHSCIHRSIHPSIYAGIRACKIVQAIHACKITQAKTDRYMHDHVKINRQTFTQRNNTELDVGMLAYIPRHA